jgi:acetolactate synthase I/II/III large subunit
MQVYAALADMLARHRVSTVFGVMGDANMFMIDTLVADHGVHYVAAANEAGAVLMAAGYAAATGDVGVATVTYGPGLANTLGVLVSAARERAPVALITGETPSRRPRHSQRIDQAALIAPTGAGYQCAGSAGTAARDLESALRRAATERLPIVFSCPADFTFAETAPAEPDYPMVDAGSRQPRMVTLGPDPSSLDLVVGMLASARRPVVLAGAGCVRPDASGALRRLAEAIGAPLMTTLPAKGLFGADKYDLGVLGSLATPRAVEAIMASDCVVAIGASLSTLTGGGEGWPYFAGKTVVHCDIDPAVLGSQYPAAATVAADAITFADTVIEWLREVDHVPGTFREVAAAYADPQSPARPADATGRVGLRDALSALNQALPTDRLVTVDGGRFTAAAVGIMDVPSARAWASSFRGFGAVGNALSTAIGMSFGRPGSPSVVIVGDGGFMLGGLAEFNTAVRHDVDLVVVVCNDGSYGAEYRKLESRDFPVATSMFNWPDLAPVASALGGAGLTIRGSGDLLRLSELLARRDRPLLIDLKLDPAGVS